MASCFSHPFLCFNQNHRSTTPLPPVSCVRRNANPITRYWVVPKSSPQRNPTPKENPIAEFKDSKSTLQKERSKTQNQFFSSLSSLFDRIRNKWRGDNLGFEILSIALPAALALAADPLASLVDSAFVGHLGSVELAAVGVSISVFNLVSKLFNVPLLNITTSFVAEEQALARDDNNDSLQVGKSDNGFGPVSMLQESSSDKQCKKLLLPAVSASLGLAACIGIAEAVALSLGSGSLMNIMGITVESPMRIPAEHFLSLRVLGAPPVVIALAAQGTFRGFMDTKTPFYAVESSQRVH